jgi:peptidyl-prolyl cis-trans isomerase C
MRKQTQTLVVAVAASALLFAGCSRGTEPLPEENVDLTEAEEIFAGPATTPMSNPAETVVVTVNGTEITQASIDEEIMRMISRSPQPLPPERMAQVKAQLTPQIVDGLIAKTLLEAAVEAADIEVAEEEIDEAMSKISQTLPEGMSIEDRLPPGMTVAELREQISTDLAMNKLLEQQVEELTAPTEEEVKAFYDENIDRFQMPENVEASHILISVEPADDEETKAAKKAQIEELRQQLLDGASFEELASEHSDCPSSAKGGDLGKFTRGQMVPAFEEAAFTQEVGEVGDVVETRFGYHIIKVNDHSEASTVPFEEVQERIAEGLERQGQQEAVQNYLEQLKADADISYPQQ